MLDFNIPRFDCNLNLNKNLFGNKEIMCELNLQIRVQSVPITTKVMSWKPARGEVYSIQHYVVKLVSDLVGGFLRVPRFPPPIKLTTMI